MTACPICDAPPLHIEHLDHGYVVCNRCGRASKQDGPRLISHETNHSAKVDVTSSPVPVTERA